MRWRAMIAPDYFETFVGSKWQELAVAPSLMLTTGDHENYHVKEVKKVMKARIVNLGETLLVDLFRFADWQQQPAMRV